MEASSSAWTPAGLRLRREEKEISVNVDYALEVNYEYLADCRIEMHIRPKDGKESTCSPEVNGREHKKMPLQKRQTGFCSG